MLVYNIENSTEYSIICFKDFKSMSYERKLFIIFSWNGTKVLFYYLINWFQKKQILGFFSQLGNRIFNCLEPPEMVSYFNFIWSYHYF